MNFFDKNRQKNLSFYNHSQNINSTLVQFVMWSQFSTCLTNVFFRRTLRYF